ncbi:MAG: NAD(P)-dependent oxidoreductase [Firmicutes bacterium]|nr:NAD(P)-dependent oxidoreductase [Bacillota bacterium]MBR3053637.1 NAD(P)-dependent oxidoreductase [Bacillota bacterium]
MKIGFVGLGIMGESMCENIIKKHDDKVYVFDFVKEKVDKLAALGAVPCASSLEVAENADVFISMVPRSEHSRAVYGEILPALGPGKTCIDMSTIDPSVSVEISEQVKQTGAEFIDAPVVKSKPAAIAGKLGIYVGGSEEAYEAMKPILLYMGENVMRLGDNGKGLVMKICHNALVSQIQNGVNETSTLAAKNGIDILTYAQAISYGGAGNWYLDSKKDVLSREDYTTAFSIENEHKDVHICLNLAKECGFSMPGEENAARVYDEALAKGIGKEDFCATIKVVRGEI